MHPDYFDLVAECQTITTNLNPQQFYEFYLDLIPKKKFFTKYISSKADKNKNYKLAVEFLAPKLNVSQDELEDFVEILINNPGGLNLLKEEIARFGFSEAEIKKQFEI